MVIELLKDLVKADSVVAGSRTGVPVQVDYDRITSGQGLFEPLPTGSF